MTLHNFGIMEIWQEREAEVILTRAQQRGLNGRASILRHIARTGQTIAGQPIWAEAEIALLRNLYPDRKAIASHIVRTQSAIACKAQALGLVRPLRIWSDDDAVRLRKFYRTGQPIAELVEMFPGKTKRQIWDKAAHMRCRRPRRPPKTTSISLVDDVRQRAFESRLSMRDLDTYVSRKRYFSCPRHVDWQALERAMKILGGRPVVNWHGK